MGRQRARLLLLILLLLLLVLLLAGARRNPAGQLGCGRRRSLVLPVDGSLTLVRLLLLLLLEVVLRMLEMMLMTGLRV